MKILQHSHNLQLPDWGPYSKKYAGISHVANNQLGIRFDLSVFPAVYRRRVDLPNCACESNYHIWKSSPDYSFFSTRHEVEWKDQLYTDISYAKYYDCYNTDKHGVPCLYKTQLH